MPRDALPVLALALLCAAAGCLGTGPATGTADRPTTAASRTATTTGSPAATTVRTPAGTATGGPTAACGADAPADVPGVEGRRLTDLPALQAATERRLRNASGFALRHRLAVRTNDSGGDLVMTTRVRAGGDGRWTKRSVTREPRANGSWYVQHRSALYVDADGGLFRERTAGSTYEYRTFGADYFDGAPTGFDAGRMRIYVRAGNYTFAGMRTVGGEMLFAFVADAYREGVDLPVPESRYSARILVTGCGLVRQANVTAVAVEDGVRTRVTYEYAVRAVGGVTVETPTWVRERRGNGSLAGGAPVAATAGTGTWRSPASGHGSPGHAAGGVVPAGSYNVGASFNRPRAPTSLVSES